MMVAFLSKFSWVSKMLAPIAILILLSVSASAAEPRKCYWCGPLAEQVHRSTRAPSCNEPSVHVTACDPGFTHCAVVATSPPYAESRLCVKLYQDECYSLYCNSTKMWRVTCPCRGDLCNGPNTQREKESFSILSKLVARSLNTRYKRTLITSPNFISDKKYESNTNFTHIDMTINEGNETRDYDVNSDSTATELQTTDNDADLNETQVTEIMKENKITENDKVETTSENTQTHIEDNLLSTASMIKVTEASMLKVTEASNREVTPTILLPKPSKDSPTAEALQQNGSLSEKITETTNKLPITNMVPTMSMMQTQKPTGRNNTATCINSYVVTVISSILIQCCI